MHVFVPSAVVRLVNGSSDADGAVRVSLSNVEGYVCGTDFHIKDAAVICRTLAKR